MAVTEALASGDFDLAGLAADGHRRWLFAMFDADGNHEISGPREFASARPESVSLTPDRPQAEISLRLVDPHAPASLAGILTRASGDSVALWVELRETDKDSTAAAQARGRVAADGAFRLPRVAPGAYRLTVFCDSNGNGRRDAGERTMVLQDSLAVDPGAKMDLGTREAAPCPAGTSGEPGN